MSPNMTNTSTHTVLMLSLMVQTVGVRHDRHEIRQHAEMEGHPGPSHMLAGDETFLALILVVLGEQKASHEV